MGVCFRINWRVEIVTYSYRLDNLCLGSCCAVFGVVCVVTDSRTDSDQGVNPKSQLSRRGRDP